MGARYRSPKRGAEAVRRAGVAALSCVGVLVLGLAATSRPTASGSDGDAQQTEGYLTPPRVRFVPIDTLRGVGFPQDKPPWAPRGALLALEAHPSGALVVYDPVDPGTPPWTVLRRGGGRFRWSPDGRWLAVKFRNLAPPLRPDTLVAFGAHSPDATILYTGPRVWPFLWAADGNLYLWSERGPHQKIDPPAAWRAQWIPPQTPWGDLVLGSRWGVVAVGAKEFRVPAMGLQRFTPGSSPRVDSLAALDALFRFENLLLYDALPEKRLFLVGGPLIHGHLFGGLVVDDWGRLVAGLPSDTTHQGPVAYSLGPGGSIGFGANVQDDGTEEGKILSASLVALDFNGRWVVPVEGTGMGMNPWASREGSFLAYEDPIHGGICVGRLVIGPR